ncbi:eukaryotic prefoldin [Aureococcus anophagefferens]|uniref:Eukaryotic prefoldin n=1 Tax=Aureococcus anophagefferens TaxID=44056 RepID=A0ABR1FMS9_AURAN
MAANVQQEAEEEIAAYKELQGHINTLMQSRGRFLQQKSENEMEMDDVKENVVKRLEFINGEIEKVDAQVKAKQEEQEKLGGAIMKRSTKGM